MFLSIALLLINSASAWVVMNDFDASDGYFIKKIANSQPVEYCLMEYPESIPNPQQDILDAFKAWDVKLKKNTVIKENCAGQNVMVIKYLYPNKSGYYYNYQINKRTKPANLLDVIPGGIISNDDFGAYYRGNILKDFGIIINMTSIEEEVKKGKFSKEYLLKKIMIHEIGHALGLGDEYVYTKEKLIREASPEEKKNSIMNNNLEITLPSEYDLMGLTILYSKYKKDDVKYESFLSNEKGSYVNGAKEGPWEVKDTRFDTLTTCNYSKGLKNGTQEVYRIDKDKKLISSRIGYAMDKKNGVEETYRISDKKSMLSGISTYKNNTLDGLYKVFDEDGTLKVEGSYKNGYKNGDWYIYGECLRYDGATNTSVPCT